MTWLNLIIECFKMAEALVRFLSVLLSLLKPRTNVITVPQPLAPLTARVGAVIATANSS